MAHPDIYHVTPITRNEALVAVCKPRPRNLLVSMYRPDQLQLAQINGAKLLADHGRFSTWIAAMRAGKDWSDSDVPRDVYYRWLEPWIWGDRATAIMPDIPGAPSQLNDSELLDWPFPIEKGLPVYHMDGPIARFGRLLAIYPRVAMGWIGDPKREPVGCEAYLRRIDEIEAELGPDIWPHVHMLRGVAVAGVRPFRRSRQQQPRSKRTPARLARYASTLRQAGKVAGAADLRRSFGGQR
ncbi:hypothetical protein [Sphingomonas sp.]|uniref:hypothetical protein n=2 Tax=unclassified Sphingomonas TaxID=196159 RepID=UPI0025DC1410|nr:hypothetical protein [Sphingomonas sp.]